jgi:flagellar hook-length control protein FliK
VPSFAQSIAASPLEQIGTRMSNASSGFQASQQPGTSAWPQQTAGIQTSAQPAAASNVFAHMPSFAQPSVSGATQQTPVIPAVSGGQSLQQQAASAWLQQTIAVHAAGGVSPPAASGNTAMALPASVASYIQSAGASVQQSQVSSFTASAQPFANGSTTSYAATATPAAILAANSAQSVAAMFAVPTFPSALAYGAPTSGKPQTSIPSNASVPAQASVTLSNQNTSIPTLPEPANSNASALPHMAHPIAQMPQSTIPANQAGVPSGAGAGDKAVALAQAAQTSIRNGHSAPVTEAQSLPIQIDVPTAKSATGAADAHNANGAEDDTAPAANDAAANTNTPSQPAAAQPAQHAVASPAPASALPAEAVVPAAPVSSAVAGSQVAAVPAQPAASTAAAVSAPPPSTAALPSPDLNALAVNIAAKSLDGARQFDIRLDPAELGRVDVRLSLDGNGNAQAHLAAERPETLALLQDNAGALTRALQDSGVQVASNGLQFSLKGQERQTDSEQRATSRSRASALQGIAAAAAQTSTNPTYGVSPSGAGVNILV